MELLVLEVQVEDVEAIVGILNSIIEAKRSGEVGETRKRGLQAI